MRRYIALPLALFAVLSLGACREDTTSPAGADPQFGVGNEMPSGSHFQVNLIGVSKDKKVAMDDNNGRRIFVQLWGGQSRGSIVGDDFAYLDKVNKIFLTSNTTGTFGVLDANATDSDGAELTLPANVSATYDVYVRALGKPLGAAAMTTCATVYDTVLLEDIVVCSTGTITFTRYARKPQTILATDYLLFLDGITVDPDLVDEPAGCTLWTDTPDVNDPEVTLNNVALFDPCFENYFWNYDNNGLKNLQIRFYPRPVT